MADLPNPNYPLNTLLNYPSTFVEDVLQFKDILRSDILEEIDVAPSHSAEVWVYVSKFEYCREIWVSPPSSSSLLFA
jgi:hypothetical protein